MYQPLLSANEMFKQINQLQAWQTILNYPIQIGEQFTNPLRPDNNPKCYLRQYNQTIFLSDHAYPQYNTTTVMHVLMNKLNIGWTAALRVIYNNQKHQHPIPTSFEKPKTGPIIKPSIERAEIIISPFLHNGKPAFTKLDKEFWTARGITAQRLRNPQQPVYSVHHYYVNGICIYPKHYPCYAFTFKDSDSIKIYCPNDRKYKFPASTMTKNDVWKWLQFPAPNIAIITKSYKDGEILNTLNLDVDIYAFMNEGNYDVETLDYINKNYELVIIIYDNDKAGMDGSINLSKELTVTNTSIIYPKSIGKDTDDMIMAGKTNLVKQMINDEIRRLLPSKTIGSSTVSAFQS